jgi:predicted glycosyltransferase
LVLSKKNGKIGKIWLAMSTPFQANFYSAVIKQLEADYEFLVTAREHDAIFSILKAKKIDFIPVGKHGGRELSNKLEAYASTIQQMLPIVQSAKPDLLLTERWPEAVRVGFGLNIPAWTIFYDEREKHVNQMVFPLASKVFVPRFYTFQELYQSGVPDPEKVVWFNGFHTCYLKGMPISSKNPFDELGIKAPRIFVRPEPEFASFFPDREPVLEKTVDIIQNRGNAEVVVLPRTEEQRTRYGRMGAHILNSSMVDIPVAHTDVALGAAETMLMEAFILGKPAVSSIYWTPSKPVVELHRYISHSTDPVQIADYVEKYLDSDEAKAFSQRASLLVGSMDNPATLMAEEIRRMENGQKKEAVMRRRSKIEIYLDIIQAASLRPLRPTYIMRDANISYNDLKEVLDSLERRSLIRSETTFGGKFYQATEEGLRLLQQYKLMRERLFAE